MYNLLVLALVASVDVSSAVPTHECPKGTHLLKEKSGWEVCPLCQDGVTYMNDHFHRHPECLNCTRLINPEVELLVTDCNITHNTVIHCRSGFYRRLARNPRQTDQCVKCSECEDGNPTRMCQGFYDTVCCGLPIYEAVLNKDNVYICKEKPIVCTQGQYYSSHYEQCFPCPPDTYMSEHSHNNKECNLCQIVGNNSSRLLLQACNSTHPAIADCKPGYFRHSPQEPPLSDDDCSPCRACQFVGRECTSLNDTVCCDRPEMTVVDNNTGPVCVPLPDTNATLNMEGITVKPRTSENVKAGVQNESVNTINDSLTCQSYLTGHYIHIHLNHVTFCKEVLQSLVNCCTGNDVFSNTDSGMSINNILCLVFLVLAMLIHIVYLQTVNCCERVCNSLHEKKNMLLLILTLLCATHCCMFCSCMLNVIATNNTVGKIIISIFTTGLFLIALYILYTFWNQNTNNRDFIIEITARTDMQVRDPLNHSNAV